MSKKFINVKSFDLNSYDYYVKTKGLKNTWTLILDSLNSFNYKKVSNILRIDNLGELYEIGLAIEDKISKKNLGKYYTPDDVAKLMSEMLLESEISNLVDVACGTGNLIIQVLKDLDKKSGFCVQDFIKEGRVWIYDIDPLAVDICIKKIELLFGSNLKKYINIRIGDFLAKDISLPYGCSVITNPPYSAFKKLDHNWDLDSVYKDSKDYYSSFMSKIFNFSRTAVIISPQSFLVSDKFKSLRDKMYKNFSGYIFSFDNVPGALFNGKKHGIFNSSKANFVRAAITFAKEEKNTFELGFRLSHLIRFSTDERKKIIKLSYLKKTLGYKKQNLIKPTKSTKSLEDFVSGIEKNTDKKNIYSLAKEAKYVDVKNIKLRLNISSSARYRIVCANKNLDRNGIYNFYANDEESFYKLYALLNSSYFYMWWRFLDGGISLTKKNLHDIYFDSFPLTDELKKLVDQMIQEENNYMSYKLNAGKIQETIRFPDTFREQLNKNLFPKIYNDFNVLHRNREVNNAKNKTRKKQCANEGIFL